MDKNDLEVDAFFTTNGKDVWKLTSYFNEPSCVLRRIDNEAMTKKEGKKEFGINSRAACGFHRIKMPETPSPVPIGVPESPQEA